MAGVRKRISISERVSGTDRAPESRVRQPRTDDDGDVVMEDVSVGRAASQGREPSHAVLRHETRETYAPEVGPRRAHSRGEGAASHQAPARPPPSFAVASSAPPSAESGHAAFANAFGSAEAGHAAVARSGARAVPGPADPRRSWDDSGDLARAPPARAPPRDDQVARDFEYVRDAHIRFPYGRAPHSMYAFPVWAPHSTCAFPVWVPHLTYAFPIWAPHAMYACRGCRYAQRLADEDEAEFAGFLARGGDGGDGALEAVRARALVDRRSALADGGVTRAVRHRAYGAGGAAAAVESAVDRVARRVAAAAAAAAPVERGGRSGSGGWYDYDAAPPSARDYVRGDFSPDSWSRGSASLRAVPAWEASAAAASTTEMARPLAPGPRLATPGAGEPSHASRNAERVAAVRREASDRDRARIAARAQSGGSVGGGLRRTGDATAGGSAAQYFGDDFMPRGAPRDQRRPPH